MQNLGPQNYDKKCTDNYVRLTSPSRHVTHDLYMYATYTLVIAKVDTDGINQ